MIQAESRFWSKVEKTPGCWLWTGAKANFGYGAAWFDGRLHKAHRVSWYLKNGSWPKDQILHKCDIPGCVNPKHLREGDQLENIHDAMRKGRLKSGEYQKDKTHCPSGHPYSVYATRSEYYKKMNSRRCRECNRLREAKNRKE